jgi:hypothetical protein
VFDFNTSASDLTPFEPILLSAESPKLRESGKKVSIDHLITALPKRRTDFILWINFYFILVFTGIVFLATAFFSWDKFISLEETD